MSEVKQHGQSILPIFMMSHLFFFFFFFFFFYILQDIFFFALLWLTGIVYNTCILVFNNILVCIPYKVV